MSKVYVLLLAFYLLIASVYEVVGDSLDGGSDVEFKPELVGEILKEYNSAFTEDLKKVPTKDLREALKKAIPNLQSQMNDYSQNMFSSAMYKAKKPNPMLLGFALGLKSWAEGLSSILPLLYKLGSPRVHDRSTDDLEHRPLCWFHEGDEVCCDEAVENPGDPCCYLSDVCCPDNFMYDIVY